MSAGYRLSHTAQEELEEIFLYISEHSGTDRALRVHGRFLTAFEHLAEMPASGVNARSGSACQWPMKLAHTIGGTVSRFPSSPRGKQAEPAV